MSASPIIIGLTLFFSATTLGVILYPIVKILPSRLEKRLYRNIDFHQQALASLASAIGTADAEQRSRLSRQYDYHRAALLNLKPDAVLPVPASGAPILAVS